MAPRALLKVISAMATACLLAPSTAHGQADDPGGGEPAVRRVSLEEALRRLDASNLELRLVREAAATARARTLGAGARPNPGFSTVHEQLGGSGGSYAETVVGFSQTLEIGGQRTLRVDAAGRTAAAAEARVGAEQLRLAFEVHRVYTRAAQAEEDLAALTTATDEFRRVEQSGSARFVEGDISRFDRSRLRLERARYETLLAQAELRLLEGGRDLAMLIAPDSLSAGFLVLPAERLAGTSAAGVEFTLEVSLGAAAGRAEVLVADAEIEAARAFLALQRRERVPNLTVTGGYKHQTDGRQGAVLGVALPIPLWNKNQGEIAAASAELDAALTRRGLILSRAQNEIRRAWETWRSYEARRELLAQSLLPESEGLLATARVAYEEGEMTLVELLDAADAYRSARESFHELVADSRIALYDLERATGRLAGVARRSSSTSSAPAVGGAR